MAFKEVTRRKGDTISLGKKEEGFQIEGEYTKHKSFPNQQNKDRLSHVYTFKAKDGTVVSTYGFVEIDDIFEDIELGSYVKITYLGKQKVKGVSNKMHRVKVEIDSSQVQKENDEESY